MSGPKFFGLDIGLNVPKVPDSLTSGEPAEKIGL